MAEGQQLTDVSEVCWEQDHLQAEDGSSIVPLSLPPGVTPQMAARLTTSILMRQVYCTACPWTQWLLLASVGILHGDATPTLDSVSLHILLQGAMNGKQASSEDISGNEEEGPNSHLSQEEMNIKADSLEGENTDDDTIPFNEDGISVNGGLEITLNTDKYLIGASPTAQKSTVNGDKNSLEISLTPLKDRSIKASHISTQINHSSENENSLKVSHHSPQEYDTGDEKHSQQTCPVPPKDNKGLQEIHSPPKKHNTNESKNSNETSHIHLRKHGLDEDGGSAGVKRLHENFTSPETDKIKSNNLLHSSMDVSVLQQSISTQVTPRKLGIVASKWVQVKVPRRIDKGIQTEPLPSNETAQAENVETLTEAKECTECLPKSFADKEAQTLIKTQRDKSSQTGDDDVKAEDQPSQPPWKMIALSDVPNSERLQALAKKSNTDDESDDLGESFEGSNTESQTLKVKRLFHGRPMLKGKMTKPLEIPLDSVVSFLALQDPRLCVRFDSL